jgi:hypothetical protein
MLSPQVDRAPVLKREPRRQRGAYALCLRSSVSGGFRMTHMPGLDRISFDPRVMGGGRVCGARG